jgi:hypothetical protein
METRISRLTMFSVLYNGEVSMLGGGGVDDHCQFSKGGVNRVLVRGVKLRCFGGAPQ